MLEDVCVKETKAADFVCEVFPEDASVTWSHDGKPVTNEGRYRVFSDGAERHMVIENAARGDTGTVEVDLDGIKNSAELTVEGILQGRCKNNIFILKSIFSVKRVKLLFKVSVSSGATFKCFSNVFFTTNDSQKFTVHTKCKLKCLHIEYTGVNHLFKADNFVSTQCVSKLSMKHLNSYLRKHNTYFHFLLTMHVYITANTRC